MRQPLEDRQVTISRRIRLSHLPRKLHARRRHEPLSLRGFFSDPTRDCKCSPNQIQNYVSRISGPLLDRIDIQVEVPAVKYAELANETTGEPSAHVQERVEKARYVQQQRFADTTIHANANMESKQIRALLQN